jgi:hypothetical protein
MLLAFGYDLKDGDTILEAPDQLSSLLSGLTVPRIFLVPFCAVSNFIQPVTGVSEVMSVRHIPSWVPYLSYEPLALIGRKLSERVRNEPIDFVKNALVCGDRASSICADRNFMS